ncbi:hypothetical protein YC2023_104713 [Brassica napus]
MSVTVTHMNTINHVSKTCKIPKLQLPICFNRRLAFSSPRKLYPYPQLHPKTLNGSSRFNTRKRTSVSMEWQDCIVKMKVDVPASVAYNFYLYLDPESFPKLMPFISSVEVLKDKPDISRWSLNYSAFGQDINLFLIRKSIGDLLKVFLIKAALGSSLKVLHLALYKGSGLILKACLEVDLKDLQPWLKPLKKFQPPNPLHVSESLQVLHLCFIDLLLLVSSSSSSSPPEPLRPVMRSREADRLEEERLRQVHWQDVAVKMVVDAPASVAYKLYADRDLFPKWMPFLSSVEAVEGSPDLSRYLVKFNSFGQNVEYHFLAKNLQPIPDRKLHWRSIEGFANRGSVRFFPRGPSLCLVEINFSFEVPHALAPVAFLMKPFMEKLIRGGLERFAAFVKTS